MIGAPPAAAVGSESAAAGGLTQPEESESVRRSGPALSEAALRLLT